MTRPSVPDWPLSYGKLMPLWKGVRFEHRPPDGGNYRSISHHHLGDMASRAETRRWCGRLGWIALGAVIAQGARRDDVIFHAAEAGQHQPCCLAQLFFSTTVLIALFTRKDGRKTPPMVEDAGAPPLHSLAIAVPLLRAGATSVGRVGPASGSWGSSAHCRAAVVTGMISG